MAKWVVTEWNGISSSVVGTMPGTMSERQIEGVLQRLVCRHLSAAEILVGSLQFNSGDRTTALDRVGSGLPLSFGLEPCYTASMENV